MNDLTKHAFLLEIHLQCKFVLYAKDQMNIALNELDIVGEADGPAFWFYAQASLNSCANISKILWGSYKFLKTKDEKERKKQDDKDRKFLRTILKVQNDSPIKSKTVRNCFEHFDEQLFDWARSSKSDQYNNICIGRKENFNIDPEAHLKFYDVSKRQISFKDYKFNLEVILAEIIYINEQACKILKADGIFY
ncbi:TPA: hypothetical protein QCQ26_005076 [Bacillus cereus]|nr:hypothetical protein [Bacillus cereus]